MDVQQIEGRDEFAITHNGVGLQFHNSDAIWLTGKLKEIANKWRTNGCPIIKKEMCHIPAENAGLPALMFQENTFGATSVAFAVNEFCKDQELIRFAKADHPSTGGAIHGIYTFGYSAFNDFDGGSQVRLCGERSNPIGAGSSMLVGPKHCFDKAIVTAKIVGFLMGQPGQHIFRLRVD